MEENKGMDPTSQSHNLLLWTNMLYNPSDKPINLYMKVPFLPYISGTMFGISLLTRPDSFFRFLA